MTAGRGRSYRCSLWRCSGRHKSSKALSFWLTACQLAPAFAKHRVVRADHHGFLLQVLPEYLGKVLVQVSKIGMVLICLGEADGDGRAAGRLDEILRPAFLQTFHQVDRLGQVNHRGIGSGSAEAAGETFPDRDLRADEEVLIRYGLLDALVQVKGELAPVFPLAAVFPFTGVVGPAGSVSRGNRGRTSYRSHPHRNHR